MARLGAKDPNRVSRISTNVNLPVEIRELLEAAIDHVRIHSLTESIIDAVRFREKHRPSFKRAVPRDTDMVK
jgi:hypothetical protein